MWEGNRDKCCLDRREGAPSRQEGRQTGGKAQGVPSRHLSQAELASHRALGLEGTKKSPRESFLLQKFIS